MDTPDSVHPGAPPGADPEASTDASKTEAVGPPTRTWSLFPATWWLLGGAVLWLAVMWPLMMRGLELIGFEYWRRVLAVSLATLGVVGALRSTLEAWLTAANAERS